MENKSTFYVFPNSDNWFFPKVKDTFFDSKIKNIKIANKKIPIYISANTKEFNMKELKHQVNEVFKEKRNKLEKQLSKLESDYKKFNNMYDNTLALLDLTNKTGLKCDVEVII